LLTYLTTIYLVWATFTISFFFDVLLFFFFPPPTVPWSSVFPSPAIDDSLVFFDFDCLSFLLFAFVPLSDSASIFVLAASSLICGGYREDAALILSLGITRMVVGFFRSPASIMFPLFKYVSSIFPTMFYLVILVLIRSWGLLYWEYLLFNGVLVSRSFWSSFNPTAESFLSLVKSSKSSSSSGQESSPTRSSSSPFPRDPPEEEDERTSSSKLIIPCSTVFLFWSSFPLRYLVSNYSIEYSFNVNISFLTFISFVLLDVFLSGLYCICNSIFPDELCRLWVLRFLFTFHFL
jgi:hypothetical protein